MSTFASTITITITTNTTHLMDPIYPMDSITQLSLYKLYQQENALEEPILRKKVLIRNTLLMACMVATEQEKQKEQCWLDACFDQLDEDMEDTNNNSTDSILPMEIHPSSLSSATSSPFIPPPPPLPSLPPSLVSTPPVSTTTSSFLYPSSSSSSSITTDIPPPSIPSSTTNTSSAAASHTLVLAIPSEHDKFLALLDWSWSATEPFSSSSSSSSSSL